NIKEAFLPKHQAKGAYGIGVEHAKIEDIRNALKDTLTSQEIKEETLTVQDMQHIGLSGNAEAKKRREYLTERLNIGYAKDNQLRKKLNCYKIYYEKLSKILTEIEGYEKRNILQV